MRLYQTCHRTLVLAGRRSRLRTTCPNWAIPSSRRHNAQDTGRVSPCVMDQEDGDNPKGKEDKEDPNFKSTILKMLETAATTFASIAVLG